MYLLHNVFFQYLHNSMLNKLTGKPNCLFPNLLLERFTVILHVVLVPRHTSLHGSKKGLPYISHGTDILAEFSFRVLL